VKVKGGIMLIGDCFVSAFLQLPPYTSWQWTELKYSILGRKCYRNEKISKYYEENDDQKRLELGPRHFFDLNEKITMMKE
jgi:hypothetical protein